MKKFLKTLLKSSAGKLILSIYLNLFIEFLKEKAAEKYRNEGQRKMYILDFLNSLRNDLMDFVETAHNKPGLK